jgi:hypothetical protein
MPSDYGPSPSAAYAVYSADVELERIVQSLNRAGFLNEDICLLLAEEHPLAGFVRNFRLRPDEARGSTTAKLVHWMSSLGAVVIPRVGLFIRSRNFLRSLISEPKTASCLGNVDALRNLSVPESELRRFTRLLDVSSVFVYVNCGLDAQSDRAREVLRSTGGKEAQCLHDALSGGRDEANRIAIQRSPAALPGFLLENPESRPRPAPGVA